MNPTHHHHPKTSTMKLRFPTLKTNRFSTASLVIFILIFGAIGAFALFRSSAATASANLWIDTNGGTCTRQATAGAYNDAQACSSFQVAYSAASCGDVVGVQAGTYGAQSLSSGSKNCTSTTPVTITSVPGGTCTDNTTVGLPKVSISISYVTVACMNANTGGPNANNCSGIGGASGQHGNIVWNTFDHMALECGFYDSDHMRITNSTFGPVNACNEDLEDMIDFRSNSTSILDNVFDNDVFQTVTAPPDFQCGIGQHVDSMQGYGIQLTLRNSVFYGCPGQCIILRPFSGGIPGPITFENNIFNQAQDPGQAIDLGDSASNGVDTANGPILIQNNTFVNGASIHGGFNNVTPIMRNNIFTNSSCNFGSAGNNKGATYSYNVFTSGATCGTNAKSCTPTYVGATTSVTSPGDFHLGSADVCAKDSADPVNFPLTDIDGDSRPQGARADIGADEFGSGGGGGGGDTTPPTVSISTPSGGATVSATTTVSANAADDTGVVGVQFKLDGTNLGTEDTSSPYSVSWDTTAATNASHSLTAVARDAAGNSTTSSVVTVTVSNSTGGGGGGATINVTKVLDGSDTDRIVHTVSLPSGIAAGHTALFTNASTVDAGTGVNPGASGWGGIDSITDTKGNTWVRDVYSPIDGTNVFTTVEIWRSNITTSLQAGDSLSVTGDSRGLSLVDSLFDVTGLATGAPDQTHGQALSFTTSFTSGATASTTQADELLLGVFGSSGPTSSPWWTPGTNWTEQTDQYAGGNIARGEVVQSRIVSATGAYTSSGTTSTNATGAGVIAAYKAASTGGGGTGKIGDLNNDNSVNILDLSILLSHYGQSATASQGDLNSDSICNITDLSILLTKWGT